jgi:indolepyruvate ferredoxin oxidoreductase alpha subunit
LNSGNGIGLKKEVSMCTGFQALYLATIDSNVSLILGVPGYPITSLMELFLQKTREGELSEVLKTEIKYLNTANPETENVLTYRALWLTNEKVALETALGASVSGKRSLVLVKHVGMNLLSDPLITSVTHTIGAGLVIIAGDDPGVKGSQNEQDSRWYGRIAEVAVFDPCNPDAAYRALLRAYELSELTKAPVILRVTANLEKRKGNIKRAPKPEASYPAFDRSIWKYRMMEKHQLFHSKTYPLLESEAENTDLNKITKKKKNLTESCSNPDSKKMGIISSGSASLAVDAVLKRLDFCSEISHLSLNLVNPLPLKKIKTFLEDNQKVLVVEESEPFIEEQIRIAGKIYGKKTGHLPYGQIMLEDIEFALGHIGEKEVISPLDSVSPKKGKKSRVLICEDCPYLPLYNILSTLKVRIAGDMGCSVRSAPEPLAAIDVSFALGSAISVACGFEKKGIAVIGDFALAHSGILGLINAASTDCNVFILVLQNEVAAMTGGQAVPHLRKMVEAIVPDVSDFDIDSSDEKPVNGVEGENKLRCEKGRDSIPELAELILEKLALPGISVIFIKGKCRRY